MTVSSNCVVAATAPPRYSWQCSGSLADSQSASECDTAVVGATTAMKWHRGKEIYVPPMHTPLIYIGSIMVNPSLVTLIGAPISRQGAQYEWMRPRHCQAHPTARNVGSEMESKNKKS